MLKGIDISKWQNTSAVDQAQDFVIMKATEGVGYVDPTCDTKYQYAKKKGKLLGVYHFARPDQTSATAEADYFVNNTTGYWKAKEAVLVLDWEAGNTKNVTWAKAWLDRVYSKTGVRPLIYMSASVVASADWSSVVKGNYGLWIAGYPSKYNVANPPTPAEGEMPYKVSPWGFAAIWQYTSSAGTLDRDVAYMTKAAWAKYAGKADPVITTKDVTTTTSIPFETTRTPDATREVGTEVVVNDGVNGVRTVVTRITYTDGKETNRSVISDKTTAPKNKVVYYGTKEPVVETPEEPVTPEPTPEPETPVVTPEVPSENDNESSDSTNTQVNSFVTIILEQLSKLTEVLKINKSKIIAWVQQVISAIWNAKK